MQFNVFSPLNPDFNLDPILRDGATRGDVRAAFSNISITMQDTAWRIFVEMMSSAIYFKNRFWLRRVRAALHRDELQRVLDGFSLEEAFRVLYDLRVEQEKAELRTSTVGEATPAELMQRIDRFLQSLHSTAFPLQPLDPEELEAPWYDGPIPSFTDDSGLGDTAGDMPDTGDPWSDADDPLGLAMARKHFLSSDMTVDESPDTDELTDLTVDASPDTDEL